MMKRWITALLLAAMVLSLFPTVTAQEKMPQSIDRCCYTRRVHETKALHRPQFDGKLIEITPQRVEDTFRYLDDFYVKAHPEAALEVHYGTEEDREVLLKLAKIITEDCTTHKQMADAVSSWVARNIYYDVNTSAYAADTFYRREGNCLSYAFLIQTLLRSVGVPAVLGDGWRGNMQENTVDLFNLEGHAWVFVYLDGQWELYDPLWLEESTTDRDYMAKWIYFDTVEFVTPAYDEENLPPEAYDKTKAYFTGENFHLYGDFYQNEVSLATSFINNITMAFLSNQCDRENGGSDGWHYLDGVTDKDLMDRGQVYTGGWLSYGDYRKDEHLSLTYAHANGMLIDGAVMEFEGQDYMMFSNDCKPIYADKDVYRITDGYLTLPTGYTGPFLGLSIGSAAREGCTVTVENYNPDIAVSTADGIVTCLSEGFAEFMFTMIRDEDDAMISSHVLQIVVSDEERIADFTDHSPIDPELPGDDLEPTLPDASVEPVEPTEEPSQKPEVPSEPIQDPTDEPIEPTEEPDEPIEPTEEPDEPIEPTDEPDEPIEPTDEPDEPIEPSEPEIPTENPFKDVKKNDYFAMPVLWAVGKNITNGMSATSFAPNANCTRGQIVTFLWRACGSPEPTEKDNPFKDVKSNEYYYKAVLWAVEQGITTGLSKTTFGPNATCTRGQVATFLWRSQGEPAPKSSSNPFKDVKSSDYYFNAVLWAVENEVTQGMGGGKFAPNTSCSRGQIVTFLFRAIA